MLDFTRPITTKAGQKVRILCTDRHSTHGGAVVCLVGDDEEIFTCYTNTDFLINPPIEQEGWAYQENSTGKLSGFVSSINYPLKCVGYTIRKVVIKVID